MLIVMEVRVSTGLIASCKFFSIIYLLGVIHAFLLLADSAFMYSRLIKE